VLTTDVIQSLTGRTTVAVLGMESDTEKVTVMFTAYSRCDLSAHTTGACTRSKWGLVDNGSSALLKACRYDAALGLRLLVEATAWEYADSAGVRGDNIW